ncbi:uncharacterized protein METZ01_LOCUS322348, partial [marine metagenome]
DEFPSDLQNWQSPQEAMAQHKFHPDQL